jgi:hypothetical protein
MGNELIHPSLPLSIVDKQILGPDGVIGYVDHNEKYLYVCFFNNKLIVAEQNSFDSELITKTYDLIKQKYYYAFKIICGDGVTAVISWHNEDIVLIGVMLGYLLDGKKLWRDATDIKTWPGQKELR